MDQVHQTYARLQRVLEARNVAAVELRERLRMRKQAFWNWQMRGVPKARMLEIAQILRCNPQWLRTGKGEMLETGPPPPLHDASGVLTEDALLIAHVYMRSGFELRHAWRLLAEDYIARLSPTEQHAFHAALDKDLAKHSVAISLPRKSRR
jgi:hypothetical protein